MRRILAVSFLLLLPFAGNAYIEVPHSLGQVIHESTCIVHVEVLRVNTEKGLIIYKKIEDLKGKHPTAEIKHTIGKRGFHEREWKTIMAWAQPGKRGVFFYNGSGSETCIGTYWYQAYAEGEWWGLSHAEPFLLRTFYGEADTLAEHVKKILKGQEVVVTCFADGNKNDLHQRKGKLQRLKASLKKLNYDAKRDFVGWGGDGEIIEEFKSIELLAASAANWTFLPAKDVAGNHWVQSEFDDSKWRKGKAPIGYGEQELETRKGAIIAEKGVPFVFRRVVEIPEELLRQPGVQFRLGVASDDNATVWLNGTEVDKDSEDHEFAYWNREVELPLKLLKPGRNVFAFRVSNQAQSSDLYLDAELTAQVPLPRKPKPSPMGVAVKPEGTKPMATPMAEEPRDPNALTVDKAKRTVSIACAIAPRKLPNLDKVYPIEVIATFSAPRGLKAHETVVTFKGVRPSDLHKALSELGLQPGKPAYGENAQAAGPVVQVFIETEIDGKLQRLPIDQCLVHRATGQPIPPLRWHFTGSIMKQPDPEKDDKVYGADMSGTLLSLFPVTNECVLQSHLTMKDEPNFKLETSKRLPKEGTPAKLVLVVP